MLERALDDIDLSLRLFLPFRAQLDDYLAVIFKSR